ncbi:DMT family transporter [Staphylococcus equorum]|uniref:DMT family transporter n=1 Tax=Staphylococcus equorum TaxID=246432 RepID=UPI002DBB5959|nr:DMT family transporter [Staphylococcus equorum]MEB8108762.1 DMT family transporter [Staphylococcus equorum]
MTGGILGVIYLTVLVFIIPMIGVGLAMGSVVVGQMIMSALIEHYGILGSEKRPLRIEKVVAIILMIVALTLIY